MSFEKGSFALTIFRLPEPLPEDALTKFANLAAKKIDNLQKEEDIGWVSGRHLLELTIDETTSICGGHYYLNLRNAQRKIPAALLNAECTMLELNHMQENDIDYVPAAIKREIKENIEDTRVGTMPPSITATPFVIDRNTNILYLGTASTKAIDEFSTFFYETFQIEPIQVDLEDIMINKYSKTPEELPVISFSDSAEEKEFAPGRDFLTWLWYFSYINNGKIMLEEHGAVTLYIDGPLNLLFLDETKGAGETVVKKGSPQSSPEAKLALKLGKKLKKAKVTLVQGESIWSGTFDADKFSFTGLSLPDGEEMDLHSKFEERINNLNLFRLAFEEYFKIFIESISEDKLEEETKKFQKWTIEKDKEGNSQLSESAKIENSNDES